MQPQPVSDTKLRWCGGRIPAGHVARPLLGAEQAEPRTGSGAFGRRSEGHVFNMMSAAQVQAQAQPLRSESDGNIGMI